MSDVARIRFTDYRTSVARALDAIGAAAKLPREGLIIVKPNLTNADPPPVTTPVATAKAVVEYIRAHAGAEVAIGEGCGKGKTIDTFRANGYEDLARRLGLRLIDFNTEPSVVSRREQAMVFREMHMPAVAMDAFIVSLPILKDHSFTATTIAMKNMFGLPPAPHYRGGWNKSRLHRPSSDQSVFDVCLHKKPDLCVVDAVTALTGMHLAGTPKRLNLILASLDPVAVDAVGSRLLGHDPAGLEYLRLSEGVHGSMKGIREIEG